MSHLSKGLNPIHLQVYEALSVNNTISNTVGAQIKSL